MWRSPGPYPYVETPSFFSLANNLVEGFLCFYLVKKLFQSDDSILRYELSCSRSSAKLRNTWVKKNPFELSQAFFCLLSCVPSNRHFDLRYENETSPNYYLNIAFSAGAISDFVNWSKKQDGRRYIHRKIYDLLRTLVAEMKLLIASQHI